MSLQIFEVFKYALLYEVINADTNGYVAFCGVSNSNKTETNYDRANNGSSK